MFERLLRKARQARVPFFALRRQRRSVVKGLVGLVALVSATTAAAQQVQLTGLADVNFGIVNNLTVDAVSSQSICVWANGNPSDYRITATGSGAGGSFALANGSNQLAYQVRWNSQSGQANGSLLTPGVPLTGQLTNAQTKTCSPGPPTTASLIVVLPAASLSSATEGSYSGTLTLILAAE